MNSPQQLLDYHTFFQINHMNVCTNMIIFGAEEIYPIYNTYI